MKRIEINFDQPGPGYYFARLKTGKGQYEADVVTADPNVLLDWLEANGVKPAPEPDEDLPSQASPAGTVPQEVAQ